MLADILHLAISLSPNEMLQSMNMTVCDKFNLQIIGFNCSVPAAR